jgi:hypothetical protein
MVQYLGCEIARELLQAFVDGELPVDEQIAVESHLRWCRTCAAHVEDLQVIGESIRFHAVTAHSDADSRELAALQAGVLSRVRAEHEQSFPMQVRALFQDLHLFWAGLGATAAVLVCLSVAVGVLHAATDERPDSLAGVIQSLAHPGSDRNPMPLDGRMIAAPRALDDSPALDQLPEDEAVFALAAVITREGRIANYEVLLSERDGSPSHDGHAGEVNVLLDKVAQARFAPAERGVARAPVAVNMVWLLARTTVKGSARALEFGTQPETVPATAPLAPITPTTTKPSAGTVDEHAFSSSAFLHSTVA